jgi:hypothetical protein
MNTLEDDIISSIAKKMQEDIDRQLLQSLGVGGPEFQLVYSTGKIFGQSYYTIQPMGWAWQSDNIQWRNMVEWCVSSFGPTAADGVWTPDQRWYVNNSKFWFKQAKDRDWFTLRWSDG